MNRSAFFKTLFTATAISQVKQVEEPKRLSGRDRPITPEELEEYIEKKINVQIIGRITARGKDLIAIMK